MYCLGGVICQLVMVRDYFQFGMAVVLLLLSEGEAVVNSFYSWEGGVVMDIATLVKGEVVMYSFYS